MRPLQPPWGVKAYIPRTLSLVVFGSFKVPIIQYTKYPIVMPTEKDMVCQKRDWISEELLVYMEFHLPAWDNCSDALCYLNSWWFNPVWSSRSKSWLESMLNSTFVLCAK